MQAFDGANISAASCDAATSSTGACVGDTVHTVRLSERGLSYGILSELQVPPHAQLLIIASAHARGAATGALHVSLYYY